MRTAILAEDRVFLRPEEKETIITFNKTHEKASVFTYEKKWQKHIETRLGEKPIFDNEQGAKEYLISKKLISMPRAPRAKRILTEEQRQIKSIRMKNVQARRKANVKK